MEKTNQSTALGIQFICRVAIKFSSELECPFEQEFSGIDNHNK